MNNDVEGMVKRLSFENLVWIAFIVVSAFDIYGDELLKKDLVQGDKKSGTKANNIFLGATIASIAIYFYFYFRNYNDYKKYKTESYEVRLVGSIFILTGVFCLLYFQLSTRNKVDSPSNV